MTDVEDRTSLYVGLMSGTSMDGIDAVVVSFGDQNCELISSLSIDYPEQLRDELLKASKDPRNCSIDKLGLLDTWTGECFRDVVLKLLASANIVATDVHAIGSHGQTVRHQPDAVIPFSLQIGDPNVIAAGTGIQTVADFRRRDIALGGQGAPLTPGFHQWFFGGGDATKAIVNIGGIANITIIDPESNSTTGFDTGPGNTLLDRWIAEHMQKNFDHNGSWASGGKVSDVLLANMLADSYFTRPVPKSTGFEYFNLAWLKKKLATSYIAAPSPVDVQATLAELTARSIGDAIQGADADVEDILICGGGAHNQDLIDRLRKYIGDRSLRSTEDAGLHPDWVEATAFAWLAKRFLDDQPGNVPAVTGASDEQVLGALFRGTR